uniref:Kinesin motor domain-containing protein n=1 Tax=Kalanchoe fedtschenkoi TaxID=63787 RepID=A0A7N0TKP3_KALFE
MSSSDSSTNQRHAHLESDENGFETSSNPLAFPTSRPPLNSIPDPAQFQLDSHQLIKTTTTPSPRLSGRAASKGDNATPSRSVSKSFNSRASFYSSRVLRGHSATTPNTVMTVPHLDMEEDPTFWTDHNVQVLIRIRPISTLESVSQGFGRCLKQESAQSLLWLGHPETRFTFDHVACDTISQEKLFKVAGLPMVENCMSGYNSCMFAYGQTGSGKTYTMMGDIQLMDGKLNEDCGITPRIFEYLFSRIHMEEANRRDENLKYCCKCSFLEIYNEQITDLLEPSSINLQLREDLKKGVYVENLTEHSVVTVSDVIKILVQGTTNRKVASTHMNSESSRSHSVFTCTIESHWEKDSMTHIRFGRLNLVDLAGSERQKTSGAEGDRLKEAANINKSLSTLGLVIMSLVDMAQGKQRHVPYRDSRLTFLLQDSLGGNSKTMIIANVSPSICSATETLSTLKFAQRAKLIQNNAKVNEDASGDVPALQRQVHMLKDQLSLLIKHHNLPKCLPCPMTFSEEPDKDFNPSEERHTVDWHINIIDLQHKKIARLEASLVGALRREKQAEEAAHKLEAEIEHLNRLAQQRDEDAQRSKMMLRFREEKIKRLEMLRDGPLSYEKYLMEENDALLKEIQTLHAKIDRNPEVTRFALENIRLLEHLQLFQNFYEKGERDNLRAEISDLRDQLLDTLDIIKSSKNNVTGDIRGVKAFKDCKEMNSKLMSEFASIQNELKWDEYSDKAASKCVTCVTLKIDSVDSETLSKNEEDNETPCDSNGKIMGDAIDEQSIKSNRELEDAKLLIHDMEAQQLHMKEELKILQDEKQRYLLMFNKEKTAMSAEPHAYNYSGLDAVQKCNEEPVHPSDQDAVINALQNKINSMSEELDRAIKRNSQYQEDHDLELSRKNQKDTVFEQVEMETARTILHLQEEVATLQSELQDRLSCMAHENMDLRNKIAAMEAEIKKSMMKWERATLELTSFLIDGSQSLTDVSSQIEDIAFSFPQVDGWIHDQVKKAAKVCIEKEEMILLLQRNLEDAQNLLREIEMKIISLRGATFAVNESEKHEADGSANELMHLVKTELSETNEKLSNIENSLKSLLNIYSNPVKSEAREPAESGSDYSTSSTDSSTADSASHNGETCIEEFYNEDVNLTGASVFPSATLESESSEIHLQNSVHDDIINLGLDKELRQTKYAFRKLYSKLAEMFFEEFEASPDKKGENTVLPCTGSRRKRARTCPDIEENSMLLQSEREMESASSFLTKFLEAQSTIKEADIMLNALVDANERSKQLTSMWRQAGKDLLVEKASLLDEVEQLKHSAALHKKENVLLQEELEHSCMELRGSMSFLETSFTEMQLGMEEHLKAVYSELSSIVQGLLSCIHGQHPLYGKDVIENEFVLSLPQECYNDGSEKERPDPVVSAMGHYPACQTNNNDRINMNTAQYIAARRQSTSHECLAEGDLIQENDLLKKEIKRNDGALNDLLFDFSLLHESTSKMKDEKDENQKLVLSLNSIPKELELKIKQLDSVQAEHEKSKRQLSENESLLSSMNTDVEQAKEMIEILSAQNAELGTLVEDLYNKKSETEEQLEEQKKMVRSLEKEVLQLSHSTDNNLVSSTESVEDVLREAADEKSSLIEEIKHLKDKLEMARALADENEALVVEARQESEASKIYAQEKEEEARILEHSVEELESTVNVLEQKVFEMDEEVKRHKSIRDSLELEVKSLRQRMLTVETLTENMDPEQLVNKLSDDQLWRQLDDKSLELQEACSRIMFLEGERSRQDIEIKQLKEYISEIVLHAEAQASQYQQKYKSLEAMICEVKTDTSRESTLSTLDRNEKLSTRTRGSSSPFRCISSLVQQMNMEKDQELSGARQRIEELEALYSKQKKEVCMLNSRLAAAESMTHDVIRDLLGVKLDITNYANIIDQHQVHQLLEVAHQQTEEAMEKEQEILLLRRQIGGLIEERESLISDSNQRRADALAAQMTLEQLHEQKQWLSAQNKMLKTDKLNLKTKVAELDDMVKRLLSMQNSQQRVQQPTKIKGSTSSRSQDTDFTRSLTQSEQTLSRVNNELAQYRRMTANHSRNHNRTDRRNIDTKYRN